MIAVLCRPIPDQTRVQLTSFEREPKLGEFGALGAGIGEMARPTSVAFDGEGLLHVADEETNRITAFTVDPDDVSAGGGPPPILRRSQVIPQAGKYVSHWGVPGSGGRRAERAQCYRVRPGRRPVRRGQPQQPCPEVLEGRQVPAQVGRGRLGRGRVQPSLGHRSRRRPQRVRRRLEERPHPEVHRRWRVSGLLRRVRQRRGPAQPAHRRRGGQGRRHIRGRLAERPCAGAGRRRQVCRRLLRRFHAVQVGAGGRRRPPRRHE